MTPAQLDHQDDQRLNAEITAADIKESFESYLDIVDPFYAEDVEVVLGEGVGLVRGRDNLRERLTGFLVAIHIMTPVPRTRSGGSSPAMRSWCRSTPGLSASWSVSV
jgi:hypothetical protein